VSGPPARAGLTALCEYFVPARLLRGGLVLAIESERWPRAAVALAKRPMMTREQSKPGPIGEPRHE
jgi:hypothetical protein